ncbi:hypothetical protein [Halomonas stenophila]|uniref:Uncharacterized protein n=1 Tax=Halomonas stenophila TaxID=795312 RepID=A0A7W5EV20_9GAMM|nr:hypothetical protein [Halomonas stenophila]MBB3231933.1 hypothetical protein [Halomonas stenophila]
MGIFNVEVKDVGHSDLIPTNLRVSYTASSFGKSVDSYVDLPRWGDAIVIHDRGMIFTALHDSTIKLADENKDNAKYQDHGIKMKWMLGDDFSDALDALIDQIRDRNPAIVYSARIDEDEEVNFNIEADENGWFGFGEYAAVIKASGKTFTVRDLEFGYGEKDIGYGIKERGVDNDWLDSPDNETKIEMAAERAGIDLDDDHILCILSTLENTVEKVIESDYKEEFESLSRPSRELEQEEDCGWGMSM